MNTLRFWLLTGVAALMLAACSVRPTVLPTPATLPPLPTPNVPPRATIEQAIQQWQRSQTTRYFVEVEEGDAQGTRRVRVVVADGAVRAAQVLSKTQDGWGEPQPLEPEQAQAYTVDALLDRVLRDATGQGVVPYDMLVVFDPGLGFPAVVQANARETYAPSGEVQLNREYSYRLSVSVKALLEDTFGAGRKPVLTLRQSGGASAWCDVLFLYEDGSSLYADDCSQTLLQFQLPPKERDALNTLLTTYGTGQATRLVDGGTQSLEVAGQGTATPDAALWEQAAHWYALLSRPIGAGMTLLFAQGDRVMGMELQTFLAQPTTLRAQGALYGAQLAPAGDGIAYGDERGLRWYAMSSGDSTLWIAGGGAKLAPLAWSADGKLLLGRQDEKGATLGWLTADAPTWHDLPLPDGYAICVNGWDWSPDGERLALTAMTTDNTCTGAPPLMVVDVAAGQYHPVPLADETLTGARTPRWSPDGEMVYFSAVGATAASLMRVTPDGSRQGVVAQEAEAQVLGPLFDAQGNLYYAIQGGAQSGIQVCDLTCRLLFPGDDLLPLSFSPDDDFLLYRSGAALKVWILAYDESVPVTRGNAPALFVGWLRLSAP